MLCIGDLTCDRFITSVVSDPHQASVKRHSQGCLNQIVNFVVLGMRTSVIGTVRRI